MMFWARIWHLSSLSHSLLHSHHYLIEQEKLEWRYSTGKNAGHFHRPAQLRAGILVSSWELRHVSTMAALVWFQIPCLLTFYWFGRCNNFMERNPRTCTAVAVEKVKGACADLRSYLNLHYSHMLPGGFSFKNGREIYTSIQVPPYRGEITDTHAHMHMHFCAWVAFNFFMGFDGFTAPSLRKVAGFHLKGLAGLIQPSLCVMIWHILVFGACTWVFQTKPQQRPFHEGL